MSYHKNPNGRTVTDIDALLEKANTAVQGDDSRLSDARTPTSHDHSGNKLAQENTHQSPDTDVAPTSIHHTVGTGANQAAAGNHSHDALNFLSAFYWGTP